MQGYVGNCFGDAGRYEVFEFSATGNPVRPVSGHRDAAWPSAVQRGDIVEVFAAERVAGVWKTVHRWRSIAGAPYADAGVAFAAGPAEPHGIGPATVTFDGSTYRLFYAIRGIAGPSHAVGLATSEDGASFERRGVVFTPGAEAPGGVSVSYACSDGDDHYLFLHAYSADLSSATSILARGCSPDGPYAYHSTIMAPSGRRGTLSGVIGNCFAQFTGPMVVGSPIVVKGTRTEPYIPVEIVGGTVYFDRPLDLTHGGDPWADFIAAKADISFVRKLADGTWTGAITGYEQFAGATSEYTSPISAESITGPWTVGKGYFLSPYFNSGRRSTENPEPIRSGP